MAWKTSTMLSERSEFVLRAISKQESFSELCREFGISRECGYKWKKRFEQEGLRGLQNQSRRPKSSASKVAHEITVSIVAHRQAHPRWGATKIRKLLKKEFPEVPSRRTIHRIMQDCNLVTTRQQKRRRALPERVVKKPIYPNHVWTVDFKGWWRTRDGKKVYPLTIRDEYSRFILAIDVLPSQSLDLVKERFMRCFQRYGLPEYIRSDNGSPFAFSQGFCGLSRLSAWWLKLGIVPNFIPPASPQYNAAHERMHLDMAKELEETPARDCIQQQLVCNSWREEFNSLRPHDALNERTPSEVYRRSKRKYRITEPALEYPESMQKRYVNWQGKFMFSGKRVFFTKAVGGENIGLDFTDSDRVDIYFGTTCLGYCDTEFTTPIREYDLITGKPVTIKKRAA